MKRLKSQLIRMALAITAVTVACAQAYGQCAMCKTAVNASKEASEAAGQLNLAVLVLLIPPVAIFVGIFGIGYKYRNSQDRNDGDREKVPMFPPSIPESFHAEDDGL